MPVQLAFFKGVPFSATKIISKGMPSIDLAGVQRRAKQRMVSSRCVALPPVSNRDLFYCLPLHLHHKVKSWSESDNQNGASPGAEDKPIELCRP